MSLPAPDEASPTDAVEWFRVAEISGDRRGRVHFVDEETAAAFARFLVDEGAELVVLETWRGGRRVDVRLVSDPEGTPED